MKKVLKTKVAMVAVICVAAYGMVFAGDVIIQSGDVDADGAGKFSNMTADMNEIFLGIGAGANNTTGINVFIGGNAGYANTTGSDCVFIGQEAGANNTTAYGNVFIGRQSGNDNTTGYDNTFVGKYSGLSNTSGSANVFFGEIAGDKNTTGYGNAFIGSGAGVWNTTGWYNTAIGRDAGFLTTTGDNNTFLGAFAGRNNGSGSGNIYIGYNAGYNETSSNKLYIENSDANSSNALIYGDFSTNDLRINGDLEVNGAITGAIISAVKTADESVTSSTTLQDDDHLVVTLKADKKYVFTGMLFVDSAATPDLKFCWTGPAGIDFDIGMGAGKDTTATTEGYHYLQTSGTTDVINFSDTTTRIVFCSGTIFMGGTAGDFKLQWAQNTSNATATTIRKGSYIRVERID